MFKRLLILLFSSMLFLSAPAMPAFSADAPVPIPNLNISLGSSTDPTKVNSTLQLVILLTVLSVAPSLLIMVTSFTRIIIVLSFLRQAIGAQMAPPNQIIAGFALFLTFFVMAPVFDDINKLALQPYVRGKLSQAEAFENGMEPLRKFMFKQTRKKDLALFVKLSRSPAPRTEKDVSTLVLIPAFCSSELQTAFQMGFAIYIPFLLIDMVISTLLMSMGMMMLPPVMISLPFKIILFVLADGWNLVVRSLVLSFH